MSMRFRRRKRKPSQLSPNLGQDLSGDIRASEIVKKVASLKQGIDDGARPRGTMSMAGNRYNSSGLLPSQTHNRSWGIINEPTVREPNFSGSANQAGWMTMDPFANPEMHNMPNLDRHEREHERIAPGKVTLKASKGSGPASGKVNSSASLRVTKAEKIYEASDDRPDRSKKTRKKGWFSRAR